MLVDVQVSSINTSFSRSITGCASLRARRAACTSSRSCSLACTVFFEGEVPFVQLVPQSADLDPNAAHFEPPRNLRRTIPAIQRPQHALAQILRIGLH